jgi:hypothetical protein
VRRPAAAPLVDRLIVEAAARPNFGVGEIRMLGEHQRQAGAADLTDGCGVLGRDLLGLGELLGCELGLIVGFGQRHGELP